MKNTCAYEQVHPELVRTCLEWTGIKYRVLPSVVYLSLGLWCGNYYYYLRLALTDNSYQLRLPPSTAVTSYDYCYQLKLQLY